MPQTYAAPTQMPGGDYRWPADTTSYVDPATYNLNNFTGNGLSQAAYEHPIAPPSTQLARRPINHQLVPTGQRNTYDNSTESWAPYGDEGLGEQREGSGGMEENDNIELLEEKAQVAKRDAQSKRKQIPPFVQKLSR